MRWCRRGIRRGDCLAKPLIEQLSYNTRLAILGLWDSARDSLQAQCTTFEVPEDRSAPDGRAAEEPDPNLHEDPDPNLHEDPDPNLHEEPDPNPNEADPAPMHSEPDPDGVSPAPRAGA